MDPWGLVTTFLIVCVVFIPLEYFFELRESPFLRKGWSLDLTHVILTGLTIQAANVVIIVSLVTVLRPLVPAGVGQAIREQPLWAQYLGVLVIADLGFYLMHRLFHKRMRLWKLHAIHHSSEKLDFLAAYRVHPIDQFMVRTLTMLPVFVLGFSPTSVMIFAVIYHWQAMFIHSNTRFRLGILEYIVATPAFHHWHHANMGHRSCNYAGQLALIDWIAGTYHVPATMPAEYGIGEPGPDTYVGQILEPLGLSSRPAGGSRERLGYSAER